MLKQKVKKNDEVLIISGKDRGKTGKVIGVFPVEEKITVSGINLVKRHVKKSKKFPQGGRVELSAKLHASNVKIICQHCKKATRVSVYLSKTGKERLCRKCGKPLDKKDK